VPTRVWGRALAASGAVDSTLVAQRVANNFIAAHLDLLAPGARLGDFELVGDDLSAGIRSLGFVQRYHGRRVVGGQLSLRFKHDRLALIASEALPHVRAVLTDSPIADDLARARALEWLRGEYPAATAGAVSAPVILPLVGSGPIRYVEARAVDVASERPLGGWIVYVDAATGAPLARVSTFVSASGTVLYDVPERSPSYGDRVLRPAPFLDVTIDDVAAATDAAGVVSFDAATVQIGLGVRGEFVRIINKAGDLASQVVSLDEGSEVQWSGADDPHLDAQLTAYVAGNAAKEYVRAIASEPLAWLDGQVNITVSDNSGACNAMSNGDDLFFFDGNENCENTARIPDVVYHEAGHSVHNQALIPGVGLFEGALSEGISDYLSATMTGDPRMARGFFLDSQPLRDLNPDGHEWHWPEDRGEAHDEGRIIGGTLWDLRTELIAEMGEAEGIAWSDKIWYESIRRASDIPTMYPEALLVDDDDGDLSNGTPHSCLIDQVFYLHGLVGAAILGGKVRTLAAEADGSVPVALDIQAAQSSCIDLAPTGATLEWRVRGTKANEQVAMTATAEGFAGALPAQQDGTVIEYRVLADISDGTQTSFPANPAYPWYQRYYGPVVPIWCEGFEGDLSAWQLGSEWEVGAPQAKSGDPEAAFAGDKVAGIDLTSDGRYSPQRVMNLNGPVVELPPGFATIRLQYQRWLNVEDAHFDRAEIMVNGELGCMMGDNNSKTHHRDSEWSFHDIDITPVAFGGTVQLTYRLSSDGGLELGGWNIDDVCVVGVEEPPPPVCGDGVIAEGEGCDDGNPDDGDGCSASCTVETPEDPTGGPQSTSSSDTEGDDTGEEEDSATSGNATDTAGCGCHGAGGAGGSSAWLLALAGLGWRRRTRP
jgi:cysteine-rich repeat protein